MKRTAQNRGLLESTRVFVLLSITLVLASDARVICAADASREELQARAQKARALLSNRCFACHGPDEENREAGLRLDDPSGLFEEADSGDVPVVPGDWDSSSILQRIASDDEYERMPPPEFGAKLSDDEVGLLKQWIADGAEFPQHWSFVAPTRPDIPDVQVSREQDYVGQVVASDLTPIDAFVRQHLGERGLRPSPPAEKPQLLRRLSLDLTGLPPTLAEIDAFLADDSPEAYRRQVERLLASPRFGERWGRKWLDLARYADSAGYADDPPRTIWAYRDWVIKAINDGIPVDDFTRKQLAGDLLPNPSDDDLIATAFNRNTMTNSEGGTNDEEFRNAAVVDRVNTTMAVWMGLTMGCAQCHTHKYDPITHHEYFQVFAVFNNTADADRRDESPLLELFTRQQRDERVQLQQDIRELRSSIKEPTEKTRAEFALWLDGISAPDWAEPQVSSFRASSNSEANLEGSSVQVKVINANLLNDSYTLRLKVPDSVQQVSALAIDTIVADGQPGAGQAQNGNFVITDVSAEHLPRVASAPKARYVRVELPGKKKILSIAEVQVFAGGKNVAPSGKAKQSSVSYNAPAKLAIDSNTSGNFEDKSTTHTETTDDPWWELDLSKSQAIDKIVVWNRTDNNLLSRLNGAVIQLLDEDRNQVSLNRVANAKASNSIKLSNRRAIKFAAASSDYEQSGFPAAATIDGDQKSGWAVGGQESKPHSLVLPLEKALGVQPGDTIELTIAQKSGFRNHVLGSFRVRLTESEYAADWFSLSPEMQEVVNGVRSGQDVDSAELLSLFHRQLSSTTLDVRKQIARKEKALRELKPATSVPIMREVPEKERRDTFVQIRGNYKSHGDQVQPGVPEVFHDCDAEAPNRLDLANWLVDKRNPLTARVWVNRAWETLFGRGIVRTSEEFGAQGDLPTHPQLLDWLAIEFMESGWDNKALIRKIVLSATYQQSSATNPGVLEIDADNTWLARGPAMRLSAEMVRDTALSAGGLLAGKIYGNPVRPPQPNLGLKAAFGSETDWKTSAGENRYRRGLYTMWRRSNPYPSMATFDAPSGEVCTLRRDSTNTPLQALVTLNDPAFVEAAQAMARRTLHENPPGSENIHGSGQSLVSKRLAWAFRVATSRVPSPSEIDALQRLHENALEHFAGRDAEAVQLATQPIGEIPDGVGVAELAAWTAVCNVLLNLDEVLMKR